MNNTHTANRPPKHGKIQVLEGLRAAMAWWVVGGHLLYTLGSTVPFIRWFLENSRLAVDVFIMLSGFVIVRLIDNKQEGYSAYLARRAFRIFPLYLFVLFISSLLLPYYTQAMSEIPFYTERNADRLAQDIVAMRDFSTHILIHIPLLQGLVPTTVIPDIAYTIVGQAWSVSLEFQFYLVAPLIWLVMIHPRWLPLLLMTMFAGEAIPHMSGAFLGWQMPYFLVGVVSYRSLVAEEKRPRQAWIGALLGLSALIVAKEGIYKIVPLGLWFLIFFASSNNYFLLTNLIRRVLGNRLMIYLGERSYSTYLVHMIPLYLTTFALNKTALPLPIYATVLSISTVIWTLLLSDLTFRIVEKPGIRLGQVFARQFVTVSRQTS